MPTMVASSTCSSRMPAILPPLTNTSLGHFSIARIFRGNNASTVSATARAVMKLNSPMRKLGSPVRSRIDRYRLPGGLNQVCDRRPRPEVCSSAWTTVPCGAPSCARRRASSLVEPIFSWCQTVNGSVILHAIARRVRIVMPGCLSVRRRTCCRWEAIAMSYSQIEYRTMGAIARINHNRPELRNAESSVLLDEMDAALRVAVDDPAIRVIIIGGNGAHFSAGHDLKESQANRAGFTAEQRYAYEELRYLD